MYICMCVCVCVRVNGGEILAYPTAYTACHVIGH